uniref:ADP/ATP translocase n=1 Tax=Chromera velia CCMP2878 TaxID=1169474 RepID=A0A0G4HYY5_9ALVE|eukprot:Cvel_33762.t1-p1 / transcript=Cvel_33762.t1 / gene=Cvel_33762 / organism=Chromera_velia_CCMP2878 / gene_product=Calcium-binding mitochondrial carrier protein, putative / transcript_product=Calcium-binding mitochondrial carrier protein, putative / location=Cvel_scaffold5583:183-778(-) / protein_length=167 / sequence_SO=supercontig / SO=protein_coding / is_pseudo=false
MFCKPDSAKYKNMIQSWNLIRKEEGFLALWKGNGINMLRAACAYGLKFTTNEWSLQRNRGGAGGEGKGGGGNSLGDLVTAGFTAGLVQKTITYPIDVWSVRVAMGANTKALGEQGAYRGMWDCAFRILRNEGVQGFYKGYMLTLATGWLSGHTCACPEVFVPFSRYS